MNAGEMKVLCLWHATQSRISRRRCRREPKWSCQHPPITCPAMRPLTPILSLMPATQKPSSVDGAHRRILETAEKLKIL